jgi:MscS family membrane protein
MRAPDKYFTRHLGKTSVVFLLLWLCPALWPQAFSAKPTAAEAPTGSTRDILGRSTPRGTVLGLLGAARKGNLELAARYLNTPLRGAAAAELAEQLTVVINRGLPARLDQISDKPEGSIPDPLKPDEDLIGVVKTSNGELEILLERIDLGKSGKVWLFSRETLASIPNTFQELSANATEEVLPEFLVTTRVAGVPVFQLLALFLGTPLLYLLTGLLNRILGMAAGALRRRLRRNPNLPNPRVLRPPIRLLLVALAIRWLISKFPLPLLARQFWSTFALLIVVVAFIWLLMQLNAWGEHNLVGRGRGLSGQASALRLARRCIDGVILFAGLLFILSHFGVDVTAALAGLGVGGIAVALAAQKTLENIIAGVSLIVDQAVQVGDLLNLGDIQGTVVEVGLRSTRIRTPDRTIVSLPNGQIANMRLETLSARDSFWFHPVIGLRYETTPAQIRLVMVGIRNLLKDHASVDPVSVRVRFIRLGVSSLDVDIFAYVVTKDWNSFLEIQEELLLDIMNIVQQAGAEIAFPSQTLYLGSDKSGKRTRAISEHSERPKADALH